MLDKDEAVWYYTPCSAGLAHLVERHLAKVEVASSSLVARSKFNAHTKVWALKSKISMDFFEKVTYNI